MTRTLILFAHPRLEMSRANALLIKNLARQPGVTLQDLYQEYPDFNVDIEREKELLLEHEVVIWQHPIYWYSAPALLKQWIDLVLEYGWAYGPKGDALKGKMIFNLVTTGGRREVYQAQGRNRYSLPEFLRPFEQTARLCHMEYLPPYAILGTHLLNQEQLTLQAKELNKLIAHIRNGLLSADKLEGFELMNDWMSTIEKENR